MQHVETYQKRYKDKKIYRNRHSGKRANKYVVELPMHAKCHHQLCLFCRKFFCRFRFSDFVCVQIAMQIAFKTMLPCAHFIHSLYSSIQSVRFQCNLSKQQQQSNM